MRDYAHYEFHLAAQKLHNFCSEFLGAFYLDILKDRLYTSAVGSPARRSAQSALHHVSHCLLRLLAPILSFTAEEAWGQFTRDDQDSIFLHTAYVLPDVLDAELMERRWMLVRETRTLVQKELEQLRVKGIIGSSLQGEVTVKAGGATYQALAALGDDLRFVFITSGAEVVADEAQSEAQASVRASEHTKCGRCWHYRADVGVSPQHPELCGRCVSNLFGDGEPRAHA